ncbi:hypothetical protein DFH09DRAFT_1097508 [Mycena vulgaris]|nr:hypothetical protein DFH09DRAFT_1097508 [Mycena vulgaris]
MSLSKGLRTLAFTMELDPQVYEDEEGEMLECFWILWDSCLPGITKLHTLTLAYCPEDSKFLARFLHNAQPQYIPSLRKLYLVPLDAYDWVPEENRLPSGADPGPWTWKWWSKYLCDPRLAHLQYLIIKTARYPFWPPTVKAAEYLRNSWFHLLPASSKLSRIILVCGAGDEACRIGIYRDEQEAEDPADLLEGHPASIPAGMVDSFETIWPAASGDDPAWHVPVLVWNKHIGRDGLALWEEGGRPGEECAGHPYCGFGGHLYFDVWTGGVEMSRVYGYERELFYNWPHV